jgi:phage terminase small subunit
MNKKPNDLTEKEWKFVLRYPLDFNGTKSYKETYGVTDDNVAAVSAYRLLRKPKIRAALKDVYKEAAMDLDEMLSGIADIARNENNDLQARLRAYEMIGRGHAAFTDKIKSEGDVTINVTLDDDSAT